MANNDLLIYTNDDTVLLPSIDGVLREWMKDKDCGCSFRNNYYLGAVKSPDELNCKNTQVDFGRDLFVFKVGWLRSHWADIPDCLNGASEWDYFLALYFRHLAKIPLSMADMHFPNPKTEMERGHVFHEAHQPNRHAEKLDFLRVENYNKSEVKRAIKALGIKGMHLSS